MRHLAPQEDVIDVPAESLGIHAVLKSLPLGRVDKVGVGRVGVVDFRPDGRSGGLASQVAVEVAEHGKGPVIGRLRVDPAFEHRHLAGEFAAAGPTRVQRFTRTAGLEMNRKQPQLLGRAGE